MTQLTVKTVIWRHNVSMPNCHDAKTYRRQSVSATKLIIAKKSAPENFRPETSRRQNIAAKTSALKRSSLTVLTSEQIRGTKLVTEKKNFQMISSYK